VNAWQQHSTKALHLKHASASCFREYSGTCKKLEAWLLAIAGVSGQKTREEREDNFRHKNTRLTLSLSKYAGEQALHRSSICIKYHIRGSKICH
jgi:hypothetical protein